MHAGKGQSTDGLGRAGGRELDAGKIKNLPESEKKYTFIGERSSIRLHH